jgi:hypothetical protein
MSPAIVWFIFVRKNSIYRILGVFFTVSAVLKISTIITAKTGVHNMPLYHLLALTEVMMVSCFYTRLMSGKINRQAALLLMVINLFSSLFIQKPSEFNSLAWTLNMMVIIGLGITYLFRMYNDDQDVSPLEKRPDFMITAGWLLYAAGSLFTYLLGTSILSGKAEGFFHNAWIFQCVSNLIKNCLISYGLWRAR